MNGGRKPSVKKKKRNGARRRPRTAAQPGRRGAKRKRNEKLSGSRQETKGTVNAKRNANAGKKSTNASDKSDMQGDRKNGTSVGNENDPAEIQEERLFRSPKSLKMRRSMRKILKLRPWMLS